MVDPDSGRVPRAPPYSGTAPGSPQYFAYAAITLSDRPSQTFLLYYGFLSTSRVIPVRPYNPALCGLGSSRFARRYSGNLILISFPELLRWFTSLSLAPPDYLIHPRGS